MKLMRRSGVGSTYSSSRLSSLWLLVHSDTLPCLCKTVLFLRPPKGVQQWLKTPKWPYQLFYYFSHGVGGGSQGGRNRFSARRFSKIPAHPMGGLFSVITQNLYSHLGSKEREQGKLCTCCWGYLDIKVTLDSCMLPMFLIIQGV